MLEILFVLISFFGMKLSPGEVVIPGKRPPVVVVTYPGRPAEMPEGSIYTPNGNTGN